MRLDPWLQQAVAYQVRGGGAGGCRGVARTGAADVDTDVDLGVLDSGSGAWRCCITARVNTELYFHGDEA